MEVSCTLKDILNLKANENLCQVSFTSGCCFWSRFLLVSDCPAFLCEAKSMSWNLGFVRGLEDSETVKGGT